MVRPVGRIGRQLTLVASAGAAAEFRVFLDATTFQSVSLSWLGTLGGRFRIYRNGVLLATVTGNTFTDTGVLANTSYTYQIAELDASNNEAAFSPQIGALTPVAPPPDPDPTPGDTIAPEGGTVSAVPVTLPTGFIVAVTLTSASDAGGMDYYTLSLDGNFLRSIPQADFSFDAYTFNLGPGDGLVEGREYLLAMTPVDLAGNAGDTVTATFTTPVVTPLFQVANLGTATPVLSAGVNNLTTGEVLGTVGGAGIGGTADSGGFAFVTAPADDNFSVTGRVASLFGGNPHGGLMIRESATAGAVMVAFTVAADGGSLRTRATTGANAVGQSIAVTPPIWLRLEYASGLVTASTSPDGSTWTVRGTATVTFNGTPLVGYAFASRVNGTFTTGAFDNFARVLTPPDVTAPTVPALTTTVLGTSSVRLDWTASTDAASGVKEYRLTRDSVALATVPFGTRTYTDVGRLASTTYTYGIRAVDNAGNISAEDTENATTDAAGGGVWFNLPEIILTEGNAGNTDIDLRDYYPPPEGFTVDSFAISSTDENGGAVTAVLPTGVTASIVSSYFLRLADTGAAPTVATSSDLHCVATVSAVTPPSPSDPDDPYWSTQIAAAGVLGTERFDSNANIDVGVNNGTQPKGLMYSAFGTNPTWANNRGYWENRWAYDTTTKLSGAGSLRLDFPNTRAWAQWRMWLDPVNRRGFRFGSPFGYTEVWYQFAFRPSAFWINHYYRTTSSNDGPKIAIPGNSTSTRGNAVHQHHYQQGFLGVYIGLGQTQAWGSGAISTVRTFGRHYHPAVDRGTPTVTDRNTSMQRHGPIQQGSNGYAPPGGSAYVSPTHERSTNHPDPNAVTGSLPFVANTWHIITGRAVFNSTAGQDGIFQLWMGYWEQAPRLLISQSNVNWRTDSSNANGWEVLDLLLYMTDYIEDPGQPTASCWYDRIITSRQKIQHPGPSGLADPPGIL